MRRQQHGAVRRSQQAQSLPGKLHNFNVGAGVKRNQLEHGAFFNPELPRHGSWRRIFWLNWLLYRGHISPCADRENLCRGGNDGGAVRLDLRGVPVHGC